MQIAPAFDDDALAIVRRAYAVQMLAMAGVGQDLALEQAFAAVRREEFLGSPPWRVPRFGGRLFTLPTANPVLAYQDVLLALAPERGVNNGSPSLHALWLHSARIRPGDRVVHVGAGTGYYSAVIAHLVGESGHITAVEYDGRLADLARANLSHLANVVVVEGDGGSWPREEADCVYVNFSVERPASAWIDRLAPDGRLIFPLGVPRPNGGKGPRYAQHGAGFRAPERRFVQRRLPGAGLFRLRRG